MSVHYKLGNVWDVPDLAEDVEHIERSEYRTHAEKVDLMKESMNCASAEGEVDFSLCGGALEGFGRFRNLSDMHPMSFQSCGAGIHLIARRFGELPQA